MAEWKDCDQYARNRVLRRLMLEREAAAGDVGERAHQDEEAYSAAIKLLSSAARG